MKGIRATRLDGALFFCLIVAVGLRIFLVIHTQGLLDGDEAMVGIQAQHILRGERPVYFYGIPYFGSLEAYLVAALFALLGSSLWTMRVEPILLSLLLVTLTWRLAGDLAASAKLSVQTRRLFQVVAALCAAVPPLYDGAIEARTWGDWIELYVIILLLFSATLQLTRRWISEDAPRWELCMRWAGLGFLVGLGFWVYPLIAPAALAAAVFIAGSCILAWWRDRWRPLAHSSLLALVH